MLLLCTRAAWQLLSVQRSLGAYYERFKSLLSPVNAQQLQQLLHIAAALHACLQQQQPQQKPPLQQPASGMHSGRAGGAAAAPAAASTGRVVGVNDLLFELRLDNVNMFELARWMKGNKIAFKVRLQDCGALCVLFVRVRACVHVCMRGSVVAPRHSMQQLHGAWQARQLHSAQC